MEFHGGRKCWRIIQMVPLALFGILELGFLHFQFPALSERALKALFRVLELGCAAVRFTLLKQKKFD